MSLLIAPPAPPAPADGIPAVRVRSLTKSFDRRGAAPVLEEVSLEVTRGEFVCVLGASGCGKSTLLNLITGLEAASKGVVEVRAADGNAARPTLMFQESALFPWLSAGANVELALRLRGVPKEERRIEAERLLALVRLDGAAGKRVHELSGGMRQRVALARALAQDGPALLMDEPFAALDAITRDLMHDELIRVWSETGVAVLFVTHNVHEAVRLGQRVILLSSRPGRVIREWRVDIPQPRRIEDAAVGELALEITAHLRAEISRHART